MKDRLFFDTNIVCYAYDASEPEKRKVCKKLVEEVFNGNFVGVVSNQILGEIFNALVTKLDVPVKDARIIVESLLVSDRWEKINYTENTIRRTVGSFNNARLPFWDLVITETMKENNLTVIITENEKDFDRVPGVEVRNPLR